MKRLLAASFGIVLFVACTGDETPVDGVATGSPTASATPTPTVTAKSTPWVEPLPPEPTARPRLMQVKEPVALEFRVSSNVGLVVYEAAASEQEEWWWQKLYEVDADVLWTVADDEGTPYSLRFGPEVDRGIGTATGAGWSLPAETVLVDLETGEVTELLPYPAAVVSWLEPDRVLLRLLSTRGQATSGLVLGTYVLDLEAETLTLVSREPNYREREVAVPEGSVLTAGGMLEWRIDWDLGLSMLVLRDDVAGTERVLAERLEQIWWAPNGRLAALGSTEAGFALFDPMSGEFRELGALKRYSQPAWSPDGRYLAVEYTDGNTPLDVGVTVLDLNAIGGGDIDGSIGEVGPFAGAEFADWGPGAETMEALLLADVCQPGGFLLDRLDLATGELTRIPTAAAAFWVYDWSPRGDLIAVSSWDVDGGFALLGAETGARAERPLLDAVVTSMQDVVWSASGDWIALGQIGGRDRCWV